MNSTAAIIILGAVASTRMASPKQLVFYRDKTLLEDAICTAQQVDRGQVVVVLGAHAELITRSLNINRDPYCADSGHNKKFNFGRNRTHFLHNSLWNEGQSSSIVLGV